MAREDEADRTVVRDKGDDRYEIVATERFDCSPTELWELLCDWERLVAVGLPGMTGDFRWLSGGPRESPSTFEFSVAGTVLKEEIYELTADEETNRYRLRYRALGPALGVLEYDAVLDVEPIAGGATALQAVRTVRLEQGSAPDMLAGMVDGEMQSLKDHFAGNE
jgi:hypothetical protein